MPKKKKLSPLGRQIRVMRVSRLLTQMDLSELSGVSQITISNIETGSTSGNRVLPKILKALEDYDPDADQEE